MKKILLYFICFWVSNTSFSQQNLSAKEILKLAVAASGGNTWQQPKTLQLSGNASFTPFGKKDSSSFYFDTYKMYRVFPSENNAARVANGKVKFDAKYGDSIFMQLIFDSKISKNYLSEKAKPYQKYFSWSNNFGFSIIRFADRDSFVVSKLVNDNIEGFECFVVQIKDPKNFITTFWIDAKKYFIRSVGFVTDLGWHQRIYSNFEKLNAGKKLFFIQPKKLKLYFEGIKWMEINWINNKVNEQIEDIVFQ